MLKLRVSGTKNDLKSFRKWLKRANVILPKYEVIEDPEFKVNSRNSKYYRYEADLIKPLNNEGGKGYGKGNCNSESKGWGWKNHYNSESWSRTGYGREKGSTD